MTEPDEPVLIKELRNLRRTSDDGVSPEEIAVFPTLCQYLGRGDPYLAVGGLRDRLSTAAARGDRDLLALYYSLQPGGDATSRFVRAGQRLFVEYRRARDLSDSGIRKLAKQIAADADWQVPFMGVVIDVRGKIANLETYVQCVRGYVGYRHPKHLRDGEEFELSHRVVELDSWERHVYGPMKLHITKNRHVVLVRRIGSPSTRINIKYTSDNPLLQIRSQHAYLTYALEFELHQPTPDDGDQYQLFELNEIFTEAIADRGFQ